jgi:predicted glycoside hydrolase/deacetylase ChbG (UPF0249 family)
MSERRLIVNADDLGLSEDVDRGIARAHEHGIVTSASLMVRGAHAADAAAYAAARPELSVGLHVDLGEWRCEGGTWVAAYEVVPPGDAAAVREEVAAQLERFLALTGRAPTHLDSHQHVHREEPARAALLELGEWLGVPVRELTPGIRYEGGFYGQARGGEPWPGGIASEALRALLRALPPGTTELGCHPGLGDANGSPYAAERAVEVATLCDPLVRATIEQEAIELCGRPAGAAAGVGQ